MKEVVSWSRYYSIRTRILLKNGSMERCRVPDTQRIHRVSGPVFFLNRTFSAAWNIRCPETSLKRSVSRPVKVLIFLDLPRIMEWRWWTLQFLPLIFTKTPHYGLCYPNIYETWRFHSVECDEIPRYVKFPVFSLARNSMVGETQKPLKNHWNSTVHEIIDVEIVAKLPDTRKLHATPLLY